MPATAADRRKSLVSSYWLALVIQIAYYGIAALGLNILVGFTGQISLGHSAFFGFGAFMSAYLSGKHGVPVALSIPLAGIATGLLGVIVGLPAARLKGLYLAIATLASQFVLQDFFSRAGWFTGGASGANAAPFSLFGLTLSGDRKYYYVVLFYLVIMYVFAANLVRTRDGRAMVAVRDHYLSAEIMGINLTYYRILAFGISSLYAGIGGALMAHYIELRFGRGFRPAAVDQFPRHDHHRRPRLRHGQPDGHGVHPVPARIHADHRALSCNRWATARVRASRRAWPT